MEKENKISVTQKNPPFSTLLLNARSGDGASIIKIVEIFEPDIYNLARFIQLPQEDVIQTLKAELIQLIKQSDIS
ncbi:helix-turn-helix domain-containing protein [Brevibacillus panacihumi]|uniref:helix-turn-helix domain-containing protein n=1 Tax=Brevibacillus panacihumi TaxID=497735 RepID=UPI003D1B6923